MSHYSDLDVARQRAAFIKAARSAADDVFNAFAVPAGIILGLGVFFAAPLCAVFGATLAAVYVFCASCVVFAGLFIIAHVASFLVFNVKTWNA